MTHKIVFVVAHPDYVLDNNGTSILEEIQKNLNIPAEGSLF